VNWSPARRERMDGGMEGRSGRQPFGPFDIRHVVGEAELAQVVKESAEALGSTWSRMGGAVEGNGVPASVLLTVLTYSYVIGCYESSEVVAGIRQDELLRQLSANRRIECEELRRFRRRHRPLLRRCMGDVLRRLTGPRRAEGGAWSDGDASYLGRSIGRWSGSGYEGEFEIEAEERIGMAVRADSIAMDD
jgi:hypothetical protein